MTMKHLYLLGLTLCCFPLYSWQERIASMSRLYRVSDMMPKVRYPHNITNNWWSDTIVPQPPVGVLESFPAESLEDVASLAWQDGLDITNAHGHVYVCSGNSFTNAIGLMMMNFAFCSAPQPFPKPTGVCTNLGDVCYTGYPAGSSKVLNFVRNNVYVYIDSTEEPWSVATAFAIDSAILDASTNSVPRSKKPLPKACN